MEVVNILCNNSSEGYGNERLKFSIRFVFITLLLATNIGAPCCTLLPDIFISLPFPSLLVLTKSIQNATFLSSLITSMRFVCPTHSIWRRIQAMKLLSKIVKINDVLTDKLNRVTEVHES